MDVKRVDRLVRGFAASGKAKDGARLTIIGSGDKLQSLVELSSSLGCCDSGEITDSAQLRALYNESFAATSPGYAGLSVTQSLGFGVPILVADNEPHAPEIELAKFAGVCFFTADSTDAFAELIRSAWRNRDTIDSLALSRPIIATYSAESIANGLFCALTSTAIPLAPDGWPKLS